MTTQQIEDRLNELNALGSRLGLDTMRALTERLGNPQDRIKTVHVAGTNGKGTAVMTLAHLLQQTHQKVGTYTSPAVVHWREGICVGGTPIDADCALSLLSEIFCACDSMTQDGLAHPTRFEVETALAFLYFCRVGCQIAVIEVGLGGILDATNVIKSPEFVVLTPISLDHTAVLGDTLTQIATAKCGIIKPETTVYYYPQPAPVMEVLLSTCDAVSAKGVFPIDKLAGYKKAKQQVSLFGRYTEICKNPSFIVDGAHNPAAVEWLLSKLDLAKKHIFLVAIFRDKDYTTMLKMLAPHAKKMIAFKQQGNERLLDSTQLQAVASRYHDDVSVAHSPAEAVKMAFACANATDTIVSLGSLSTIYAVFNATKEHVQNG